MHLSAEGAQVWRPLKGPVDEAPLAVVDAQTTEPGDLLPVRLEFPHRTGYTYTLRHSPSVPHVLMLSSCIDFARHRARCCCPYIWMFNALLRLDSFAICRAGLAG